MQRECGIELEASLHRLALDFRAHIALPPGVVSAAVVAMVVVVAEVTDAAREARGNTNTFLENQLYRQQPV